MLIGVDFDNTIICYDQLFFSVARERGCIPEGIAQTKKSVRDYLWSCQRNDLWTELQGIVYGERILEAEPFEGVMEFFHFSSEKNLPLRIVSHKTRFPAHGDEKVNLRDAAMGWLRHNGFLYTERTGLIPEHVYFESSREQKIDRLDGLNITHFIDDLVEIFEEPSFPSRIVRILFSPHCEASVFNGLCFTNWKLIQSHFLEIVEGY